jgi:hypothetical protein
MGHKLGMNEPRESVRHTVKYFYVLKATQQQQQRRRRRHKEEVGVIKDYNAYSQEAAYAFKKCANEK